MGLINLRRHFHLNFWGVLFMRRIGLCGLVLVLVMAYGLPVPAQQPTKVPRIGYLNASSATSAASRVDAFRRGLRQLGYVEGKNIVVEYRFAEGDLGRLHPFGPNSCSSMSTSSYREVRP